MIIGCVLFFASVPFMQSKPKIIKGLVSPQTPPRFNSFRSLSCSPADKKTVREIEIIRPDMLQNKGMLYRSDHTMKDSIFFGICIYQSFKRPNINGN